MEDFKNTVSNVITVFNNLHNYTFKLKITTFTFFVCKKMTVVYFHVFERLFFKFPSYYFFFGY